MFDPKTEPANSHLQAFNPLEPISHNYGAVNFSSKPQKAAQNYEKYRNRNWNGGGGLQFRPENIGDDSGVCSPPLWGNKSPARSPFHSKNPDNNSCVPHDLSPSSRAQAIARGQLELMEMVKAMPESSYELSLKDLVEYHSHRVEIQNQEECLVVEEEGLSKKGSVKRQESAKRVEKKGKMVRSGSNINENKGLFLKMVFPITLGGKRRRRRRRQILIQKFLLNRMGIRIIIIRPQRWLIRRSGGRKEVRFRMRVRAVGVVALVEAPAAPVAALAVEAQGATAQGRTAAYAVFSPFYSKKSLSAK